MLAVMTDKKVQWNCRVFRSVAESFDQLVEHGHRGDKGTTVSAACIMFLMASPEERQRYVDMVKLAEGRGADGTILQAVETMLNEPPEVAGTIAPASVKKKGKRAAKRAPQK